MSLYVLYKWFHRQLPEADMKLDVKRNVLYTTREEERKQTVLYVRENLTLNDWYEQQDQFKLAGVEPIWILDASRYVRYAKLREARGARLRGSVPKAIFQETGVCYYWNGWERHFVIDTSFEKRIITFQRNNLSLWHEYDFHIPFRQECDIEEVFIRGGRITCKRLEAFHVKNYW